MAYCATKPVHLASEACTSTSGRYQALTPSRTLYRNHFRRSTLHSIHVAASSENDTPSISQEERWESQVREGRIKNVTPSQIRSLLEQGEDCVLLDVRPPNEIAKAALKNAIEIPVFVVDDSLALDSLIKKATSFGMGGWWLGGTHMVPNLGFLSQVQSRIPKDAKIIVVCQKGLRSLAACEQLALAGYPALFWLNGGLDTLSPGDLPTKNDVDIRRGGIGGVSELVGWTEVQQETKEGLLESFKFETALLILALLVMMDAMVYVYRESVIE